MDNEKKHYNPCSSYPECSHCPARGTNDCPALYRYTEHCPHYSKVVRMLRERKNKKTVKIYCAGCGVFLRETEISEEYIEFEEYCIECYGENEEEEDHEEEFEWDEDEYPLDKDEFPPKCGTALETNYYPFERGYQDSCPNTECDYISELYAKNCFGTCDLSKAVCWLCSQKEECKGESDDGNLILTGMTGEELLKKYEKHFEKQREEHPKWKSFFNIVKSLKEYDMDFSEHKSSGSIIDVFHALRTIASEIEELLQNCRGSIENERITEVIRNKAGTPRQIAKEE